MTLSRCVNSSLSRKMPAVAREWHLAYLSERIPKIYSRIHATLATLAESLLSVVSKEMLEKTLKEGIRRERESSKPVFVCLPCAPADCQLLPNPPVNRGRDWRPFSSVYCLFLISVAQWHSKWHSRRASGRGIGQCSRPAGFRGPWPQRISTDAIVSPSRRNMRQDPSAG